MKYIKRSFWNKHFADGESIGNNRLLDTLPSWGPEFQISVDIKMTSFAGSHYKSIISFTNNPGHCCDVGDRIPAILLKMDTKQLHVGTQIDSNGNSWANSKSVEINTWYNMKMTQKLDSSDGKVCTLSVDCYQSKNFLDILVLFRSWLGRRIVHQES